MKITDLMILLIIFGIGFTAAGQYILGLESQYASSNYTAEYNENQYEYLISQQASKSDGAVDTAEANTDLGSGGSTTDPYENIFISGWNSLKDLVGVGSDIESLQADLETSSGDSGLQIPGYLWAALAGVISIIILATLVNASQRVSI